ncbi:hypothetical protein BQ8794_170083 [Mesorhizobium prunaredense]|uniref:Uncharacterized protein n=1 Tax=Mesorhizobium prunaredense TaxID=1631249 RepID=A0A1R3V3Y3_9HYPH|nr:hypothetical protein BQ8794_170083 [Mesorhizobium prunaredense]
MPPALTAAAAMYAGSEGRQIAKVSWMRAIDNAVYMSHSIAHQGHEGSGAKDCHLHQPVNRLFGAGSSAYPSK